MDRSIGYNLTKGGIGGTDYMNTEEVQLLAHTNQSITKLFSSIENHIEYLESNGLEITSYNYVYNSGDRHCINRHLPRVFSKLSLMKGDSRWNQKLEDLFKGIDSIINN